MCVVLWSGHCHLVLDIDIRILNVGKIDGLSDYILWPEVSINVLLADS